MKITGNYENKTAESFKSTAIGSANGTAKSGEVKENGKENKKSESNNIYGGNLRLGQDEIASRQAMAGQEALKKIMDVFSGTLSVDREMERSQEDIDNQHETIKSNMETVAQLDEKEKGMLEKYGVEEFEELSPEMRDKFTDEMKSIKDERKELNKGISDARKIIAEQSGFIKAVHKERLKHHEMVDAQKEAAEILEEANREVTNMMVDDAVDEQDEQLEEIKERAEEQKEQQVDSKADTQQETPVGEMSQAVQKDILNAEADKLVSEKKITREDIKGIACDEMV